MNNKGHNKIQDDKDYTSSLISSQTRYIGFLLASAYFMFLTSNNDTVKEIYESYKFFLFISGMTGCLTILFDLIQYLAGYKCSHKADKSSDKMYDKEWLCYKIRVISFYTKQITAVTGAIILIVLIVCFTFC